MTGSSSEKILIVESDPDISSLIARLTGAVFGCRAFVADNGSSGIQLAAQLHPEVMIINLSLPDISGKDLLVALSSQGFKMPVIVMAEKGQEANVIQAFRLGASDYLTLPMREAELISIMEKAMERSRNARRETAPLEARIAELESLLTHNRSVTTSLDLNQVLSSIVTSAVELTGADEANLLLPDETTHELYLRAGRKQEEKAGRAFHLPVQDPLADQVIQTGQAVSHYGGTTGELHFSHMMYSLIYVPLLANGHTYGVLSVNNRTAGRTFTRHHELLMRILADFAANAIQNAQSFGRAETQRARLETTINNIQDGVILLDPEQRIRVINPAAKKVFGLGLTDLQNLPVTEAIPNNEFLVLLDAIRDDPLNFHEIALVDGRVYNTQFTPIPEVGSVISLEDITHLKLVDRLKSDYIHTISHDLRSPLTAIMGYVELLERVGPLTDQQKIFVKHIQTGALNITELVNDLLDLGRIEAGFDARKEDVSLGTILRYTLENISRQVEDKQQVLTVEIEPNLPVLRGNPLRLRQIIDNLLGNAIKYTPENGKINVSLRREANQIILIVADNGIGIPLEDQQHIFEKFYRADNAVWSTPGSGLGLAIVKSIVENHSGRIWVESTVGEGTKFVVVLPTNKN